MSDQASTARRRLEANPDAWCAQDGRVCGGGVEQPNGVTCDDPGEWGLRGYVHAYCSVHAQQRLTERREAARHTGGLARNEQKPTTNRKGT